MKGRSNLQAAVAVVFNGPLSKHFQRPKLFRRPADAIASVTKTARPKKKRKRSQKKRKRRKKTKI